LGIGLFLREVSLDDANLPKFYVGEQFPKSADGVRRTSSQIPRLTDDNVVPEDTLPIFLDNDRGFHSILHMLYAKHSMRM
jgi:hypothetical protein